MANEEITDELKEAIDKYNEYVNARNLYMEGHGLVNASNDDYYIIRNDVKRRIGLTKGKDWERIEGMTLGEFRLSFAGSKRYKDIMKYIIPMNANGPFHLPYKQTENELCIKIGKTNIKIPFNSPYVSLYDNTKITKDVGITNNNEYIIEL